MIVRSLALPAALLLLVASASAGTGKSCAWRLSASVVPAGESVFFGVAARTRDDVWTVGVRASSNFAEGPTLAEHWGGARWRIVPTPAGAGVLHDVVAIAPDEAWAVGARGKRPLIERWNGSRWSVASGPKIVAGALLGVAAVSSRDVWAVGTRTAYDNGTGPPLVEHWDGLRWHVVSTPSSAAKLRLDTVSVSTDGSVWTRCHSLHGGRWQIRLPPRTPYSECRNGGADAIDARDPHDVWVSFGALALWDGTRWHRAALSAANVTLDAIAAISSHDVWAGGWQACCGGAYNDYLAHWNGVRWATVRSAFPYDVDRGVTDLSAVSANDVWAVGYAAGEALAEHYTCSG
jgi:hypothetical protein